jgi:hypothetical protein
MEKLFLILSVFILAGLFFVAPSFADTQNFNATNVTFDGTTLQFNTDVDMTHVPSSDPGPYHILQIVDINSSDGSINYFNSNNNISCTSTQCTITGLNVVTPDCGVTQVQIAIWDNNDEFVGQSQNTVSWTPVCTTSPTPTPTPTPSPTPAPSPTPTPTYVPVPSNFNATNIQWNGTDTVSFDTDVDLSSLSNYGDTNYCLSGDRCEGFGVHNPTGDIAVLDNVGNSNGIECTSTHCTITGLDGPQDLDNIDNSPDVTIAFGHLICVPDPPYDCYYEYVADTYSTVTNWPYTYVPPTDYSLTGTIYTDSNRNGVQDNGEQGYNNATVTVSQYNQTVASTVTNSSGSYSFPSLETGNYSVAVTVPSGDIATTTNPASIDLTANTTQNFGIAPATSTLTPSQNSFIDGESANSNEGASPYLALTRSGHDRTLLQFSQSQIQAAIGNDANYTATLQVTITSNNNEWSTGRQIDVDRLNQAWTSGNGSFDYNSTKGSGSGVTWNCAIDSNIANVSPNCSGTTAWDMTDVGSLPFTTTPTATTTITNGQSGTVSFNVTSDVQAFLNGTTNNGWIIKKDIETVDGDLEFGSSNSSNSPQLIITDH